MISPSQTHITDLLIAWERGDQGALDRLLPIVYEELRKQAVRYLRRERINHTLQPTALINEVYLRLVNQRQIRWQSRAHFFGIAARLMREILVDHARARDARKRGGIEQKVTLDEATALSAQRDVNLLALDNALHKLEKLDPQKSRMVELRFFSGLSIAETAEVMGVSERTVIRQWQTAKAWLHREISRGEKL